MKYNKEANEIISNPKPNERATLLERRFKIGGKRMGVIYPKNLSGAVPIIKSSLLKCSKVLKPRVNITLVATNSTDEFIAKKMGGSKGSILSRNLIHLEINTKANTWRRMLVGSIAHEFNHIARIAIFRADANLQDNIASEGLAQYFEMEIGGKVPVWAKGLSVNRAKEVWKKVKPYLHRRGWKIYKQVFYGYPEGKFPHWSGYTISYLIVKRYLNGTEHDWNDLMKVSPKELIRTFD